MGHCWKYVSPVYCNGLGDANLWQLGCGYILSMYSINLSSLENLYNDGSKCVRGDFGC